MSVYIEDDIFNPGYKILHHGLTQETHTLPNTANLWFQDDGWGQWGYIHDGAKGLSCHRDTGHI